MNTALSGSALNSSYALAGSHVTRPFVPHLNVHACREIAFEGGGCTPFLADSVHPDFISDTPAETEARLETSGAGYEVCQMT